MSLIVQFRPRPAFPLLFLHIPKTAGSSLRTMLLANTRRHVRIIEPIAELSELRDLSLEERSRLELVEGHFYFGIHELIPRPCVYLTMLREPIDRLLSLYSFIRGWEGHHLHQDMKESSIGACIRRRLTIEFDNFMVRQLTSLRHIDVPFGGVTREMLVEAKAHLDGIALLGLTEEFSRSMNYFARALGWKAPDEPRENASPVRIRLKDISSQDAESLRESNRFDIELYEYAKELFAARFDGAGTLVPRFDSQEA